MTDRLVGYRFGREVVMGIVRWLGAGLVWIVAGVVGLLGVVLSATLILLPLGIPLLMLARKLAGVAAALALPKAVRDPVGTLGKKGAEVGKALKPKKKRRLGFKRRSKFERFVDWLVA